MECMPNTATFPDLNNGDEPYSLPTILIKDSFLIKITTI